MSQRFVSHILDLLIVIRDPIFLKRLLWVGILIVIMLVSILININFLNNNFPNPPRPPDRFLDWIPQNRDFVQYGEYFSRTLIFIVFLTFATSAERLQRFPKLMFLLCVMFTLRGFAITLTPLAQITPPSEYLPKSNFIAQQFYHGMFYSGHISSALIQAFFFWDDRYKETRITWFMLPLVFAQAISMLISHQHYSIDIFGAFFVAYFMLNFNFMKLVPASLLDLKWMPWAIPGEENSIRS